MCDDASRHTPRHDARPGMDLILHTIWAQDRVHGDWSLTTTVTEWDVNDRPGLLEQEVARLRDEPHYSDARVVDVEMPEDRFKAALTGRST